MVYFNQLNYRHIPYNHNVANGGVPEDRRNVATSGCGICAMCMIVSHLTDRELSVADCVKLSEENGANKGLGTDLRVLGPVIAEMFGLTYRETGDTQALLRHLENGGEAVEILIGDHDGKNGLFSHRRHYITLISVVGEEVQILDPSYKPGKFSEEGRPGRVREDYPFLYCKPEELEEEGDKAVPLYYLFGGK